MLLLLLFLHHQGESDKKSLRDALRHRTAGAIYCKKRTKLCPVRFQYSS
jgi:hypothetical protein